MLALLICASFSAADCVSHIGVTTRVSLKLSQCVMVTDCFIIGTSGEAQGGGVYVNADNPMVTISFTTCFQCQASSTFSTTWGGAIYHEGGAVNVSMCCIRECGSDNWGTAIYFYDSGGTKTILLTSIFKCVNLMDKTSGTVLVDTDEQVICKRMNFTSNSLLPDGADGGGRGAILMSIAEPSGFFSFSECTVVLGYAATGIHSAITNPPTVEYCNFFYNNMYSSTTTKGLLYGQTAGFYVWNCIFQGNSNEFRIGTVGGADSLFSVSFCAFSDVIPDLPIYQITVSNPQLTIAPSRVIEHFPTYYCPTGSPTASPLPSETPLPSDTPNATESPLASESPAPSGSPLPSLSPHASESFPASESPIASESPAAADDSPASEATEAFDASPATESPPPPFDAPTDTFTRHFRTRDTMAMVRRLTYMGFCFGFGLGT
jgi:hypothetical protein